MMTLAILGILGLGWYAVAEENGMAAVFAVCLAFAALASMGS